jgi:(1->4)-alpha-D-glucan 1-alpha-D-glucosylmutase
MGALNSLTQTVLKLTIPGVPDFYQGTEFWDLSLVDPDNRRPVDFRARQDALSAMEGRQPDWPALSRNWTSGEIKLALTHHMLMLRQMMPHVFTNGDYRPLDVSGPHRREIISFARVHGSDAVIVAAGRLFSRATNGGRHWPRARAWKASIACKPFTLLRNILSGETIAPGARLSLGPALERIPIAVFTAKTA